MTDSATNPTIPTSTNKAADIPPADQRQRYGYQQHIPAHRARTDSPGSLAATFTDHAIRLLEGRAREDDDTLDLETLTITFQPSELDPQALLIRADVVGTLPLKRSSQ